MLRPRTPRVPVGLLDRRTLTTGRGSLRRPVRAAGPPGRRGWPRMMPNAVVVGATSYVGGFVVGELLSAGYDVVAVTRNPELAAVLLNGHAARVRIVPSDAAVRAVSGRAEVVINLAYIKSAPPHRAAAANRRLVDLVHDPAIATTAPRVVHASTIAVFGVPLRRPPSPVATARRRDDLYVDLKCQAEDRLRRAAQGALD